MADSDAESAAFSLPARARSTLARAYAVLHLVAAAFIAVPLVRSSDDALGADARAAIAVGVLLFGLATTAAWWLAARAIIRAPKRRLVGVLTILDQSTFTLLVVVLGTAYGAGAMGAAVAPPAVAALLVRLPLGLWLGTVNLVLQGIAFEVVPAVGASSQTPVRADWPIYAVLAIVYCVPATLVGRIINDAERARRIVSGRVRRHQELMRAGRRDAATANVLLDTLHTARGGLDHLRRALETVAMRDALDAAGLEVEREALLARSQALVDAVRPACVPLPDRPAP